MRHPPERRKPLQPEDQDAADFHIVEDIVHHALRLQEISCHDDSDVHIKNRSWHFPAFQSRKHRDILDAHLLENHLAKRHGRPGIEEGRCDHGKGNGFPDGFHHDIDAFLRLRQRFARIEGRKHLIHRLLHLRETFPA